MTNLVPVCNFIVSTIVSADPTSNNAWLFSLERNVSVDTQANAAFANNSFA